MEVFIDEVTSTVELTPGESLLEPAILRQLLRVLSAHLREEAATSSWEARERSPGRPLER